LRTFLFFGLIRAAAEQTRPPPFAAALLAAAATLILVAQPLMRGLLQWPFHGLQIGWMIFATATGWALVRLPGSANKGPLLWLIALTAYGSMHVLGLGLAVVTGTVAVFSLNPDRSSDWLLPGIQVASAHARCDPDFSGSCWLRPCARHDRVERRAS